MNSTSLRNLPGRLINYQNSYLALRPSNPKLTQPCYLWLLEERTTETLPAGHSALPAWAPRWPSRTRLLQALAFLSYWNLISQRGRGRGIWQAAQLASGALAKRCSPVELRCAPSARGQVRCLSTGQKEALDHSLGHKVPSQKPVLSPSLARASGFHTLSAGCISVAHS